MLAGTSRGGSSSGFRWAAVLAGLLTTFVVSLAVAGLLALAVYATSLTEQRATAFLLALGLLSLALGAGYAAHLARTLGWAHGLVVGVGYVLLSLALQPVLFASPWSFGGVVERMLLGAAAGALGGVVGVNL